MKWLLRTASLSALVLGLAARFDLFDAAPDQRQLFLDRLHGTPSLPPFLAPEGRQNLAHGASRGEAIVNVLEPRRGVRFTHGASYAPTRLNVAHHVDPTLTRGATRCLRFADDNKCKVDFIINYLPCYIFMLLYLLYFYVDFVKIIKL